MKRTLLLLMLCAALLCGCASTAPDVPAPPQSEGGTPALEDNAAFFADTRAWLVDSASPAWVESFADAVDCDALYASYTAGGGARDAAAFGAYIQSNAAPADNWRELFETELAKNYDVEISRYERTDGGLYQCYALIDGSEAPYVAVDPLTGYFHG